MCLMLSYAVCSAWALKDRHFWQKCSLLGTKRRDFEWPKPNTETTFSCQCPPIKERIYICFEQLSTLSKIFANSKVWAFCDISSCFSCSTGQKSYWPVGGQIIMKTVLCFRWNILYLTKTKEFGGRHDFFCLQPRILLGSTFKIQPLPKKYITIKCEYKFKNPKWKVKLQLLLKWYEIQICKKYIKRNWNCNPSLREHLEAGRGK